MISKTMAKDEIKHPINLVSKNFIENQYSYYKWLREEAPVYKGKVSIMKAYFLSRYDDCVSMLKDPRFLRDRGTARGKGGKLPFPLPKSVSALAKSMIQEDEPNHRRLRTLVHKVFTPTALKKLEDRVELLTHELLDKAEKKGTIDLIKDYTLPIPVTVIREMVGVSDEDMPRFEEAFSVLTKGFSGFRLLQTILFKIPRLSKLIRKLIEEKRANPQDDILTSLIHAEEEGEKLNEDELIAMVYLLIIAGYETTVHLISNSVLTLLQHPESFARLQTEPELMPSAIEEILRYNGPIHGTKPEYPTEDITLHGITIPKGSMVLPILGAANRDPSVFENPDVFDIERSPNKHLGFGIGIHYCLGAPLARLETKIALKNLFDRNPNLRLAVAPETLNLQKMPMWRRYESLPITLQ